MNVPKLRFPEFNDEWQFDKICNLTSYVDYRGKTPNKTEIGIFLVTAKNVKKGYIDYDCSKEYVAESEYEKIMHRGKPKVGDVLITTEAPCGNVAQIDKENIALAQRIIKYRGNSLINNNFLKYEFLSGYFQNELKRVTSGGTVSGVKGSILHNMEIHYCSKEEQIKLSSFLALLDKKIELQTKKVEALKLFKKEMLNNILENIINYDEIPLKKIGITYSGLIRKSKEDFTNGNCKFINFTSVLNDNIEIDTLPTVNINVNEKQNKVQQYDLFFNTSSETKNEIGLCTTIDKKVEKLYLNSFCFGFRINNNKVNNEYLNTLLHSYYYRKVISNLGQGFTRINISKNELLNINIRVPERVIQNRIALFNKLIKNDIKLELNKLDKLRKFKKGLMQSMFI